jgi:hypothetical protein
MKFGRRMLARLALVALLAGSLVACLACSSAIGGILAVRGHFH